MVKEIHDRLKNGLGRQIIGGFFGLLLMAAVGGAWELAASVDNLEDTINTRFDTIKQVNDRQDSRLNRHNVRIQYLERQTLDMSGGPYGLDHPAASGTR